MHWKETGPEPHRNLIWNGVQSGNHSEGLPAQWIHLDVLLYNDRSDMVSVCVFRTIKHEIKLYRIIVCHYGYRTHCKRTDCH